ncbi:hypothetical protein [Larsenimonas salina]|uniref:hypothetical protein n=1 Tax=Larsenimonas salina TaxID=1295565 RepID=UPI00207388FF|nr:hypothetical protein [Larsenimonas salina]MCM5703322.1 hypothetical protein [Larsenimonas salina]
MTEPILWVAIDGGGSGTRLRARASTGTFIELEGGPSALSRGASNAWGVIEPLIHRAGAALGVSIDWSTTALAIGLAGLNQPEWRRVFKSALPVCHTLVLESDVTTALVGAHQRRAGVLLALGTGSIGAAVNAAREVSLVGGFGFPVGDEASGAWLGLHASRHLQKAFDGRCVPDAFSEALAQALKVTDIEALVARLSAMDANAFARLAPIVLAHSTHPKARELLSWAGREMAEMIEALDPEGRLPLALSGGLGGPLSEWLPERYRARRVDAQGDALDGALALLHDPTLLTPTHKGLS